VLRLTGLQQGRQAFVSVWAGEATGRMSSAKRQRTDPDDDQRIKMVQRNDDDIRKSLLELYASLATQADITVLVQGADSSREFPCVSALLAAASRPLAAMLYGALRAVISPTDGGLPQLHLHGTEPWCFDYLLQYIHGAFIPLDVDTAVQLHHVADYYEVLPLRDTCCSFLLDALQPSNCCQLLARSHEVHCEPLAKRCIDLLTLDFVSVRDCDPGFVSLDPSVLHSVISREELVCSSEMDVFEALVVWYTRCPSAEKYAALPELLNLLRWHLVPSDKQQMVLERAATLRAPCNLASPKAALRSETMSTRRKSLAVAAAEAEEAASEGTLSHLVRSLLRTASEQAASSETRLGMRQCEWGRLIGRTPADSSTSSSRVSDEHVLVCSREYMIGRSRKSDIRVGQNAPMPYISSQHFRIYHSICWPERQLGTSAPSSSYALPTLEPWLEDLSQNGTFINSKLVGRGVSQPLKDGDCIELVFPQGRAPAQQNSNTFPTYTFVGPTRTTEMCSDGGLKQEDATTPSSPDCAAYRSL